MKMSTVVATAAAGAFLALASGAGASETSLLVEIPKQIRAEYKSIISKNKEAEKSARKIEAEIKDVVARVSDTRDPDEKLELRRKYLLLRARALEVIATQLFDVEKSLSHIGMLLGDLQRAAVAKGGIFEGMDPSDPEVKAAFSQTYQGIVRLAEMVEAASPEGTSGLVAAGDTIVAMDRLNRDFFGNRRGKVSLQDKQKYVMSMAAKMQAALNTIEWRRVELQQWVFVVETDGAIEKINDLDSVFGDGLGNLDFGSVRPIDEQVLTNENVRSSGSSGSVSTRLNGVGMGY